MADRELRRITDIDTLKAFGHPLRMRLYRALFVARTATASQLADQVDEAVSLVSYHLRKLADHGLIEETERQGGDGRERWWQVASEGLTTHDEDFRDDPAEAATHAAVSRLSFEQRSELYRGYLDARSAWDAAWRSASFSSEYLPRLTAGELERLGTELHELIKKYDAIGRAAEEAGDTAGRENVALHMYGFPFQP
ncbi:helix-turn-helix domain-containing protein [Streptomyces sp. NPDC002889]|uniref:helix-turn-helix domain-containing protein n=1 Tax=Streptomyces sp. NPDC002889 TaxID=3364669 RepID=UPI003695CF19